MGRWIAMAMALATVSVGCSDDDGGGSTPDDSAAGDTSVTDSSVADTTSVDTVAADTSPPATPPEIVALQGLLDGAAAADRPGVLSAWIDGLERAPVTRDTTAIFLWEGAATAVKMVGDATGWDPATSPSLERLEVDGVDVWWLAQTYETDARLDYKLVADSAWTLDPLNPRTMVGGFGANSELAMPLYETPIDARDLTGAPGGTLTQHTLDSAALGDTRGFSVYVAPGADVSGPRPVVIFHDGNDYRQIIRAQIIVDRLVAAGDVGPLVAVFAPPKERTVEYNRNDAYVSYLADELLPWLRDTYDVGQTPALTGTVGASFGGLIACYIAVTRPDVFGRGGCHSGAFSFDDDAMIDLVAATAPAAVKLHLTVGTYEQNVGGRGEEGDLLAAQRRMVTALTAKGYTFASEEHPQGHSWGLWRDRLPAALRYLYGSE